MSAYFDIIYLGVLPHDGILLKDCIHSWFCSIWILLIFGSVFLGVLPTNCLSTWIRSIWKHVHMIFCQLRIVSTIFCVHSESSLLVLSTWDYFHTGLFLVGILSTLHSVHLVLNRFWNCLLGSLATCRIVSTIGSVNSGFCSLLVLSTWKFVYLGVSLLEIRPLGSLATWHSAHVGFCPLLVLATLDSAHFCLSSLESGHLGACLLGICPLESLATWILSP